MIPESRSISRRIVNFLGGILHVGTAKIPPHAANGSVFPAIEIYSIADAERAFGKDGFRFYYLDLVGA
jgi:hypothetical protein